MGTMALVAAIKAADEDFEWYPTTTEIIEVIKTDMEEILDKDAPSVLDVGAGDGRVLNALTDGKRYAIEKSQTLIEAMPADTFIVGTDFMQQTIIDKIVETVFSNPPYSQFVEWSEKIICEANANAIYLVIPVRWQQSARIQAAIKSRRLKTQILKTCDFINGERAARVVVDVVRLSRGIDYRGHVCHLEDPFKLWFDSNFKIGAAEDSLSNHEIKSKVAEDSKTAIKRALVGGADLVGVLETLYHRDLKKLVNNYKKIEELDSELINELNVDFRSIREALQLKITSLKSVYWAELFDNLKQVTDKLTSASRQRLMDVLKTNASVDFSQANARAILVWVLKNANGYLDSQIISIMESMVEQANVKLYKSNQRTFGAEQWRYNQKPATLSHYALDYRIVLHRHVGLTMRGGKVELGSSAEMLINDLVTIGGNLGFDVDGNVYACQCNWSESKAKTFWFTDYSTKKRMPLFDVRVFHNGNIHLRFAPLYMLRLNIEFGRLKGWLRDWRECVDEVGVSEEDARTGWGCNRLLTDVFLKFSSPTVAEAVDISTNT